LSFLIKDYELPFLIPHSKSLPLTSFPEPLIDDCPFLSRNDEAALLVFVELFARLAFFSLFIIPLFSFH